MSPHSDGRYTAALFSIGCCAANRAGVAAVAADDASLSGAMVGFQQIINNLLESVIESV